MLLKTQAITETQKALKKQEEIERTRHVMRTASADAISRDMALVRPDGDTPITSFQAQVGRPKTSEEMKKILTGVNQRFYFEVSKAFPELIGIYFVYYENDPNTGKYPYKKFICGMENGFMPEFSVPHIEYVDKPDPDDPNGTIKVPEHRGMTRGWRDVVKKLIHEKLITKTRAYKEFGIAGGRSSEKWQIATGQALQ